MKIFTPILVIASLTLLGFSICSAQSTDTMPIKAKVADSSKVIVKSWDSSKLDVKAVFPGGDNSFINFIAEHFVFPQRCQELGINGYVVLRFVVDVTGSVRDIHAIKVTEACPEFTKEAIRVLKMSPKWVPGMANGKYVSSFREVPIRMSLK